jgi:polar amino acid transport system substrate-binding protein
MSITRKLIPISIVLAAGLAAFSAWADETVTFDEANAPFMFAKDGAPAGVYPALFAEAFKRMKVPVKLEAIPWKRAIACADAAECGVGGIYQNSERLLKYDYSKPYFEETLLVYVSTSKPIAYQGIADLYGKTVGVLRGWSYGDEFDKAAADKKITRDEMGSDEANFQKLAAGRVDAVIGIAEAGNMLLKKAELAGKVKAVSPPLAVNKVYLIFNKKAGKSAMLAAFDKAIESMRADGTFKAVVEKSMGQ